MKRNLTLETNVLNEQPVKRLQMYRWWLMV